MSKRVLFRALFTGVAITTVIVLAVDLLAFLMMPLLSTFSVEEIVAAEVFMAVIGATVAGAYSILAIVRWLNRRERRGTQTRPSQDEPSITN